MPFGFGKKDPSQGKLSLQQIATLAVAVCSNYLYLTGAISIFRRCLFKRTAHSKCVSSLRCIGYSYSPSGIFATIIAPSHVPPPPSRTHTPPSPIIDNSNTDFFVLLGRQPTIMQQCPKCKIPNIRTRVKTYPSVTSWLMTIGMLFVCFSYRYMPIWFVPIAFLPLMYDKVSF